MQSTAYWSRIASRISFRQISKRDLGEETTEKLFFNFHIRIAVGKARKKIGWIHKNIISREKMDIIIVYKTLVRPHLEYATQVWNLPEVHRSWNLIMEIEKVQREFTRLIDGFGRLPYPSRIHELKLTILLECRMRGCLI